MYLDLLFISNIRECPWVNLNFVWIMGAVQVPVCLGQLAVVIPNKRDRIDFNTLNYIVQFGIATLLVLYIE